MREQERRSAGGTEVFLSKAFRGPHPSGMSLREGCWCGFSLLRVPTMVVGLGLCEHKNRDEGNEPCPGSMTWTFPVGSALIGWCYLDAWFWLGGKWALTGASLSLLVCMYHLHHLLHIQHVLGSLPSALHLILLATLWGSSYNYFYFMAKETEAQKGPITCLRCHSQ